MKKALFASMLMVLLSGCMMPVLMGVGILVNGVLHKDEVVELSNDVLGPAKE